MTRTTLKNSILILGSGTSTGIPLLTCKCSVCCSIDSRDKRLRTSVFLSTKNNNKILIDTTPDLRTQLLNNNISEIDFAIITHSHADHLHGIDDLRPFSFTTPPRHIDVITNSDTASTIRSRFDYIFPLKNTPILGGGIPRLNLIEVDENSTYTHNNETFEFISYEHGHGRTMGFIHESMAYIIDCKELSQTQLDYLKSKNLDLLIIDCLQRKPQGTHLHVERSFDYIEYISPKRAGLIHIGHDLSHNHLQTMANQRFSIPVFPVFDGLTLEY